MLELFCETDIDSNEKEQCSCNKKFNTGAAHNGFYNQEFDKDELIGKRFGKLIVIQRLAEKIHDNFQYLCLCECGRYTVVRKGNLTKHDHPTHSCGKCNRECKHWKGYVNFAEESLIKSVYSRDTVQVYVEEKCNIDAEKTI